ncbi:alpha/beta hydrolase [Arthrobacter cryoconiti]|uniref:Alpha/beta hydrolase n=1 Tax=Arthrobacter cryoconiti TaxID=748907 RepID=A0ABV8QVX1_9MICC|nr:alpha/beta hydrolase-fold protein [Arthrobacter cryoconiti]MCC9068922.1 esterase family protein [Arthrobacter cryoconiti]
MLDWLYGLQLVSGVVPSVALLLGALAFAFLLIRRSRHWWLYSIVTGIGSAALVWGLAWALIHWWYVWPDELPRAVVISVGAGLWGLILGLTTAALGIRRHGRAVFASRARRERGHDRVSVRGRSLLALVSSVLIVLVCVVQVNAYFGQYPTVRSVFESTTELPTGVPSVRVAPVAERFQSGPVKDAWKSSERKPAVGMLRSVQIPGTTSGLAARHAVVYLPPAYFAPVPPILPVLVLVAGQPGSPTDWLRAGHLAQILGDYAKAHNSLAPVVVIPDPNGSADANTMCMDSALGQADTYMATDVPAWISANLNVDTNHEHWAIAGFSYGGTCAVQMVTRHPDIYPTFAAFSSEREPALAADRHVTIDRAFHGDKTKFDAELPLTLMAKNKYPQVHGWLASGSEDSTYTANAVVLEAAARASGMEVSRHIYPGGHSWTMVASGMPDALAFLGPRLGLQ